jgi:hypothetical protein
VFETVFNIGGSEQCRESSHAAARNAAADSSSLLWVQLDAQASTETHQLR